MPSRVKEFDDDYVPINQNLNVLRSLFQSVLSLF